MTEKSDSPEGDRTTAQDVVDSAVDRKGAAWVRENLSQVLAPLKLMGIDARPEDVTVPDRPEDGKNQRDSSTTPRRETSSTSESTTKE